MSRLVCGWLNWKDAAGRAKESSCRALLVKLERRGLIELPPARPVSFQPGEQAGARAGEKWPELKTTLQRLGDVELVVVNGNRAHSRVWRAMMRAHHPPERRATVWVAAAVLDPQRARLARWLELHFGGLATGRA